MSWRKNEKVPTQLPAIDASVTAVHPDVAGDGAGIAAAHGGRRG
jgi:hypothetical protein